MALKEQISELVTPAVVGAGFYLEDVEILNAGRSRVITCIVDGDIPLNLDQVTVVTKQSQHYSMKRLFLMKLLSL